ncbi:MAG TPA: tetratricopeptide repeat protein [Gemmatimonadales bacterium]|nr:tetratricopeptide repeat protein [Gemmatimonadales bacterium]
MAYTSEIEKLEARYRENPKGRNFAPLADAYRKAGLIDNAIELCQAGLTLHPDYVSGHIVHGRCLVDKKDDAGADAVFRKVLALDPENILALKVLAEVAERNNHYDQAIEWLNRLLLADPMNGEAAEGLSRVRGKVATQPITPPAAAAAAAATAPVAALVVDAPPSSPPEPPPAEDASVQVEHEAVEFDPSSAPVDFGAAQRALGIESMEGPFDPSAPTASMARPDFVLERTSETSPEADVAAPEPAFETVDFNPADAEPTQTEGLQLDEGPAVAPDPGVQVEGLARTQYEGSGMFRVDGGVDPTPFEERPTSPVADLPLIMPEELDLPPVPAAPPPSAGRVSAATPTPVPAPPPIGHHDDDDGAADQAALSQAEPVLTETMAELYLRQGHREDALRVYEALAAQRPHDARLRNKVAELSAPPARPRPAAGGQSAGAFLRGILGARPGAPPAAQPEPVAPRRSVPSVPSPAAEVPVDVAPADTVPAGEPAPGSPTRPASDAISLDSVFGEESNRASAPVAPEHVPEPGDAPSPEGGFSFDDFFGSPGSPNAGNKTSAPNARPSRPSGRARAPEKEEDLDQFQAWLKSLKA